MAKTIVTVRNEPQRFVCKNTPIGTFVETSSGDVYLCTGQGWLNLATGGGLNTTVHRENIMYVEGRELTKGTKFEVIV